MTNDERTGTMEPTISASSFILMNDGTRLLEEEFSPGKDAPTVLDALFQSLARRLDESLFWRDACTTRDDLRASQESAASLRNALAIVTHATVADAGITFSADGLLYVIDFTGGES